MSFETGFMSKKYVINDPTLKDLRSKLRKNQTDAESLLWFRLRGKRLGGIKFFRQYGIGNYIIDFYCPKHKIAIEIDGGQHNETQIRNYDRKRTEFLESQGIAIIRFWNNQVLENIDEVCEVIYNKLINPS